jgi:hypothetical protein
MSIVGGEGTVLHEGKNSGMRIGQTNEMNGKSIWKKGEKEIKVQKK